jgi:hypothetical protein
MIRNDIRNKLNVKSLSDTVNKCIKNSKKLVQHDQKYNSQTNDGLPTSENKKP